MSAITPINDIYWTSRVLSYSIWKDVCKCSANEACQKDQCDCEFYIQNVKINLNEYLAIQVKGHETVYQFAWCPLSGIFCLLE